MKKKGIPLDTIMAGVIILMILVMAAYGFGVQDLPAEAARFPIFVFGVVLAAGAGEIARSLRARGREEAAAAGGEPPKPETVFHNRKNFLAVCGMIVGYVALLYLVGFIIATILFAAAFARYFRFGRPVLFGAAAVAATLALYCCFTRLMYIHLPTGLLFHLIS